VVGEDQLSTSVPVQVGLQDFKIGGLTHIQLDGPTDYCFPRFFDEQQAIGIGNPFTDAETAWPLDTVGKLKAGEDRRTWGSGFEYLRRL
jgi:hypothetical protein